MINPMNQSRKLLQQLGCNLYLVETWKDYTGGWLGE